MIATTTSSNPACIDFVLDCQSYPMATFYLMAAIIDDRTNLRKTTEQIMHLSDFGVLIFYSQG